MSDEAIRMMMRRVWISETKSECGGECSTEDSESEEVGICCSVRPSFYAILRSVNVPDQISSSKFKRQRIEIRSRVCVDTAYSMAPIRT